MIDARPRTLRWCHHQSNPRIRFLVECLEADGEPVRYAMGVGQDGEVSDGYRLISPAPKDCGPHMRTEFGLISAEAFHFIYELEDE